MQMIMEHGIRRLNYHRLPLTDCYRNFPVVVDLLYQEAIVYVDDIVSDMKLLIGNETVQINCVDRESVKIMISEPVIKRKGLDVIISHGAILELESVTLAEGDSFDVNAYLSSKGYECNMADNLTIPLGDDIHLTSYGQFSDGMFASPDWEYPYRVQYRFAPRFMKICDNWVTVLEREFYNGNAFTDEYQAKEEPFIFTLEDFQKLMVSSMKDRQFSFSTNHGTIEKISFVSENVNDDFVTTSYNLKFKFDDGNYEYSQVSDLNELNKERSEEEIKSFALFAYSLFKCNTKAECDRVLSKAKLLGII